MGIFSKMVTAIRGGAREVGESIVDQNAVRIFEQEIHDSENQIAKAKNSLTDVMANQMDTERKINHLNDEIANHEDFAGQALEKGNEALAIEIAEKIGEFEGQKAEFDEVNVNYKNTINSLKSQIKEAEKIIAKNRRELNVVKTTESVQNATSKIDSMLDNTGSKVFSAKDSLERIKKRQSHRQSKMDATRELNSELNGGNFQSKLKEAGIGSNSKSTSDILDRIKNKK